MEKISKFSPIFLLVDVNENNLVCSQFGSFVIIDDRELVPAGEQFYLQRSRIYN